MRGAGGLEPKGCGIGGPCGGDDDVALEPLLTIRAGAQDRPRGAPRWIRLDLRREAPSEDGHVARLLDPRQHRRARINLGQHLAGIAAAGRAADARLQRGVEVIPADAQRQGRGRPAQALEVRFKLPHPGIMLQRRIGKRRIVRLVVRIDAALAAHLPQRLGLLIPRRHLIIGDRPGGGHAARMLHRLEVPLLHAHQGGAVEGRVAAHPIVRVRNKRFAVLVEPLLFRAVLLLHEDLGRGPVVRLHGQDLSAL